MVLNSTFICGSVAQTVSSAINSPTLFEYTMHIMSRAHCARDKNTVFVVPHFLSFFMVYICIHILFLSD